LNHRNKGLRHGIGRVAKDVVPRAGDGDHGRTVRAPPCGFDRSDPPPLAVSGVSKRGGIVFDDDKRKSQGCSQRWWMLNIAK
jgi:hypothetical protein